MIRKSTIFFIFPLVLFLPFILSGQTPNKELTQKEYIDRYKKIAIKKRKEYKIPASITLAQGLLESGSGNSRLAVKANNHFGIKCHLEWSGKTFRKDDDKKDECFRKYKSPEASFNDHSLFLTSRNRYSFLFDYDVTEYKKWARGLKKAGYATNPRYPQKLIELIERHNLDKYDTISLDEAKKIQEVKNTPIAKEKGKENETKASEEKKSDTVKEPKKTHISNKEELLVKRNNRIKYVIARKGDTAEKIAEELDMWTWQIEKYNELNNDREIKPGMIVYLQPKRWKGSEKHHIVKKGEDMYSISQKYGIKLNHIYRKNNMDKGSEPEPGQKLWLRRRKPKN